MPDPASLDPAAAEPAPPGPAPAERAPLELDRFLPYRVNVLASRMSRELARAYEARFGISIPEWRVIAHLAQNRDVSVREIHERVDMDKSKVSRAAARLESLGLIEKKAHPTDGRLVALQLSRKGRRLFAEIAPLALDYEARLLARLDPAVRAAFLTAVDTLLAPDPGAASTPPRRRAARAKPAAAAIAS